MRRRDFITLLGGSAVAWPLAARAQQSGKVWRIGVLEAASPSDNTANFDALRSQLRQLGYVEGRNLAFEYQFASESVERFPELAAELVRRKVDLIVTRGTPAAIAAKSITATIPIVMAASGDPVKTGIIASLARPGGNVTGLVSFANELAAKRIEVVSELIPRIRRIGCMDNMSNQTVPALWEDVIKAARSLGIEPQFFDVQKSNDLERQFDAASTQRVDALHMSNDTVAVGNRGHVISLAAQHRIPVMYQDRSFVDLGGLVSYGVNFPDLYRRAAIYVDKIFKGAAPSDLPVEQPTRFELVINLKAAKTLGLEVPPTLLTRADEVIE